uniref:Predicted protein n=1 Tax=Hordeum vulgare subsp. vulgare TaxID=112509 RepID=F2ED04_HORVV|nr:predicted protein [Hordeum vulgare subsp. vulgare]
MTSPVSMCRFHFGELMEHPTAVIQRYRFEREEAWRVDPASDGHRLCPRRFALSGSISVV